MSVTDQAEIEMAAANFGEDDKATMRQILRLFFDQWDSGGAVACMAPVLQRLIAGKPLSPLTGDDSEWFKPMDDVDCYQNRRCSTVFKEKDSCGDWIAYDIDGPINPDVHVDEVLRHRWAARKITFPYVPDRAEVSRPVVEIDTGKAGG